MLNFTKVREAFSRNKYGKYFLIGGFTFFFIKGLFWLGIFIAISIGIF